MCLYIGEGEPGVKGSRVGRYRFHCGYRQLGRATLVWLVGIYTGKLKIFVDANVRINGYKALLKFMFSCVSCIWLCPLSQSCM